MQQKVIWYHIIWPIWPMIWVLLILVAPYFVVLFDNFRIITDWYVQKSLGLQVKTIISVLKIIIFLFYNFFVIFMTSFSKGALRPSEATITSSVFKTGFISKSSNNIDKIIFISIIANFWPIQFRVPALLTVFQVPRKLIVKIIKKTILNGINANGCRFLNKFSLTGSKNRSGLNSDGFSKFSSSVWINSVTLKIIVYFGFKP